MYAIAFDIVISDLKEVYGTSYPNAYFEIKELMKSYEFEWTQGSVYVSKRNDLTSVYKAINSLSKIDWFKKSVRDIRAFKVEDWSDFTSIVKEE